MQGLFPSTADPDRLPPKTAIPETGQGKAVVGDAERPEPRRDTEEGFRWSFNAERYGLFRASVSAVRAATRKGPVKPDVIGSVRTFVVVLLVVAGAGRYTGR